MRPLVTRIYMLFIIILAGPGIASAQTRVDHVWSVVEVSGAVTVMDVSRREFPNLRTGVRLPAPFSVQTGSDGHLVLAHGQDKLTVGAEARFTVPLSRTNASDPATRIKQGLGTVLYQVEHRTKGTFQVETPFLVSVVKGTTFNIRVTADDSTVALIEGRLLVSTPDEKSHLILTPGQAAIRSAHSAKILLKDQRSISSTAKGPIRIVRGEKTDMPSGRGVELSVDPSIGVNRAVRAAKQSQGGIDLGGSTITVDSTPTAGVRAAAVNSSTTVTVTGAGYTGVPRAATGSPAGGAADTVTNAVGNTPSAAADVLRNLPTP